MDIARLFKIGMTGLNLVQSLAQQGKDVTPTITALTKVFSKHPEQITDAELDDTEAELDRQLDEFEKPMDKLGKSHT